MTRTLFIHVGPAKTGTSAIQHVLRDHDNSVVLYPKVGLWGDGSHHSLVLNFFGDRARPELVDEDAEGMFARIGEEARASDLDVVISSEILAGGKRLAEFVGALRRHLGDGEFRVEVVAVVREHFERAASLYNQRVKDAVTAERRDPDEFLIEHTDRLCYANLLRRMRKTGLEIVALNYHPAETCVARCLAHLGFELHDIPLASARNVSLGNKALIATLAANRVEATAEERDRFLAPLRLSPGYFAPSRFIFGAEAAREAERKFAPDRQFLRRQFGVGLSVPDLSFQPNALVLDERDFADIAAAAEDLGAYGAALRETARRYVRAG